MVGTQPQPSLTIQRAEIVIYPFFGFHLTRLTYSWFVSDFDVKVETNPSTWQPCANQESLRVGFCSGKCHPGTRGLASFRTFVEVFGDPCMVYCIDGSNISLSVVNRLMVKMLSPVLRLTPD